MSHENRDHVETISDLLHKIVDRMVWYTEAGKINAHNVIDKISPSTRGELEEDPGESKSNSPQDVEEPANSGPVDPSGEPAKKAPAKKVAKKAPAKKSAAPKTPKNG